VIDALKNPAAIVAALQLQCNVPIQCSFIMVPQVFAMLLSSLLPLF
jgi:hypothetical protein